MIRKSVERLPLWNNIALGKQYYSVQQIDSRIATAKAGIKALASSQRYGRPSMRVTEFITQYNEMDQLSLAARGKTKMQTQYMSIGTSIHAELDTSTVNMLSPGAISVFLKEAYGIEEDMPEPTLELARFFEFFQKLTMLSQGVDGSDRPFVDEEKMSDPANYCSLGVREIPIHGLSSLTNPHWLLRGIADGVRVDNDGIVVIETKTTRKSQYGTAQLLLAYHQALVYRYLIKTTLDIGVKSITKLLDLFGVTDTLVRTHVLRYENIYTETMRNLVDIGMAPYVDVEILRVNQALIPKTIEKTVHKMVADDEITDGILQSRTDLFTGNRGPYEQSYTEIIRDAGGKEE